MYAERQRAFFQGYLEVDGIGGVGDQLGQGDHPDAVEFGHQLFGLLDVLGGYHFVVLVGKGDSVFLLVGIKGQGMGHGGFDQGGVQPIASGLDQFQLIGEHHRDAGFYAVEHFLGETVVNRGKEQEVDIRGGDDDVFDFRRRGVGGKRRAGLKQQQKAAKKSELEV